MPYGDEATTEEYRVGRAVHTGLEPRVNFASKRPVLDLGRVRQAGPGMPPGGTPSLYSGQAPTQSKFNPQLAAAHKDLDEYKQRFGRQWMQKNNTEALTPQQRSALPDQLANALEADPEYQRLKTTHGNALAAHVQGLTPEQYQSNQDMAQRPGIVNAGLKDENARANVETTAAVGYTNAAADRVKQMTPGDVAGQNIANQVNQQRVLTPTELSAQRAAEILRQQNEAAKVAAESSRLQSEAGLNTAKAKASETGMVSKAEHEKAIAAKQKELDTANAALDKYRHGEMKGGSAANSLDKLAGTQHGPPAQTPPAQPTAAPAQPAPQQPQDQPLQPQPAGQPITVAGHTLTPQADGTFVHPSGAVYQDTPQGYKRIR